MKKHILFAATALSLALVPGVASADGFGGVDAGGYYAGSGVGHGVRGGSHGRYGSYGHRGSRHYGYGHRGYGHRGGRYYGHGDYGIGLAVAAGIGLAIAGAIINNAQSGYYADPPPRRYRPDYRRHNGYRNDYNYDSGYDDPSIPD